ncbi:MAG TPA: thioesterase family protein [Solirubrobacteraceae bacterium]|nr:thioesterase family protein [Solirubrobacteraceae bacterium]
MSGLGQATAFDRATVVEAAGEGAWTGTVDSTWSAPAGPNGGYVAAIVLRAMEGELADPARPARSLTLHYLRPPAEGPLDIAVEVVRSGRRMSTLVARASQHGRLQVLAIAAFGVEMDSALDFAGAPPQVRPAAQIEPIPAIPQVPISRYFDMRPAIGPMPFSGSDEALSGGWLRLREPRPVEAPVLAMYCDAWWPPVFTRLKTPVPAPTIDLTVHFRNPPAATALDPQDRVLAVFRTATSEGGFVEEDGELWSPDGVLLAQSRQLALLVPRP